MTDCKCGHSLEEHDEANSWETEEDEIWTNDGCSKCGLIGYMYRCMHYEENKKCAN
jgi:hypothetical protein